MIESQTSLIEIARLFFRLGATAFGGPAAHIAMMHNEVVQRRKWVSEEKFLDLIGATNLIPGPNSTEMAIHIGWERRRWLGLLVAGISFIFPAMLITGLCAWAYVRFQHVPSVSWLLYGVKPVILAVVIQAIWGLVPKAAKNMKLRLIGMVTLGFTLAGMNSLIALFGAGFISMLVGEDFSKSPNKKSTRLWIPFTPSIGLGTASIVTTLTLSGIFGVFFKIGAVLFGSGYVLLAFLRTELVERLHWLSESQLIDAIAVGQVTPGPVFTTATFVGYILAGWKGALVATAGIFAPAFIFVALSGPLVPRLRASRNASLFLDGVNVASLALMVAVTLQLAGAALVDIPTVAVGLTACVLLVRLKVNSAWLIGAGALVGWGMRYFQVI